MHLKSSVCSCWCYPGCIMLQAAAAVSCVNSDVVIYWLLPRFNSDGKQSWGEPTDGPIYPMGNLVRGIYPTTQQNICVCRGVCVLVCVFKPERGFNRHTDKVIHSSILGALELTNDTLMYKDKPIKIILFLLCLLNI